MGLRFFDFECSEGHVTEILTDAQEYTVECPKCFGRAHRLISAPRISLEGCSGDFPGAYDKWEKVRIEKRKDEQSKSYFNPDEY